MDRRPSLPGAIALWGLLVVLTATKANAGDLPWDQAKEFGAVSVRDRPRDDYAPTGVRIGNYVLVPELDFRTTYIEDSQSVAGNRGEKLRTGAGIGFDLRSQFSRHMLNVTGFARVNMHDDGAALDYIEGKFRAVGRFDIDHATSLFGETSFERGYDDAVDSERPTASNEPVTVGISRTEVGIRHDNGRIDASVGARYVRYDYNDSVANNGNLIDQDARDFSIIRPFVNVGARFSPGYRVFAEIVGNVEDHRGDASVERDARGLEASVGVELELTPLVQLRAMGGYLTQDYLDPALQDVSTYTYQAELKWLVSPLVTLTFGTNRGVSATAFAAASGRIATSYNVRADYEFRRNVILSAEGSYRDIEYIGEARTDEVWIARAGIEYFVNRNWVFTLGYEHQDLKSSLGAFDREFDKVSLGVKYRY